MLDIDICNLALSYINKRPITSFDGDTAESIHCRIQYPVTRKQVLCEHLWSFSLRDDTLTLASEDVSFLGFSLSYLFPPLCLRLDKVLDETGSLVKFATGINAMQQRRIYTDSENVRARYTQDVTDANLFDALFTQALSRLLAANMSISLMGSNKGLTQYLMAVYKSDISAAQARDSNTQYEGEMTLNPYITARD